MSEQNSGLKVTRNLEPTAKEDRYFLDPKKGDAYAYQKDSPNAKRNPLEWALAELSDVRGRAKALANQEGVELNSDGHYVDASGNRVAGKFLGILPTFIRDADIYKARRLNQRDRVLDAPTVHEKIVGVSDEGDIQRKEVTGTLFDRAEAAGLIKPGGKYNPNDSLMGISNSANFRELIEELPAQENLTQLQKQLRLRGKSTEGNAFDLQTRLEEAGAIGGETKAWNALERDAARKLGVTPQALKGLNPESGSDRVGQRAGQPKKTFQEQLADKEFEDEREKTGILAQDTFNNPTNTYARAVDIYNEKQRIFERKQDHLQELEANEAAYQFKREQQRMDHEMKQFEIRETNKMLREQYEKELEIEEQRRSEADFDNLTRMIMGMAGNL